MSPFNLEDIENYLLDRSTTLRVMTGCGKKVDCLEAWLRDRFAELRAREAAVLKD